MRKAAIAALRQNTLIPIVRWTFKEKYLTNSNPDATTSPVPAEQEIEEQVSEDQSGEEQFEPAWLTAVRAARDKKALDIVVLDLTGVTSFTDYFIICSGSNPKQAQAISDEIGYQLKHQLGEYANSVEGYNSAEWILADYGDFIIHVFQPKSREYFQLERLWKEAKILELPPDDAPSAV